MANATKTNSKRTNGKRNAKQSPTVETSKGERKPAPQPTAEKREAIVNYGRAAKPVAKAKGFVVAPHKIIHSGMYGIAKKPKAYNPCVLAVLRMLAQRGIVGATKSLTSGELGDAASKAALAVKPGKKWADGGYAVRHSIYEAAAHGHAEVFVAPDGKLTYALTESGKAAVTKA